MHRKLRQNVEQNFNPGLALLSAFQEPGPEPCNLWPHFVSFGFGKMTEYYCSNIFGDCKI